MESIERRVKLESISMTYIRKLYNSLYMILLPRLSIVMKLYEGRVSVCSRLVTFKMGETSPELSLSIF